MDLSTGLLAEARVREGDEPGRSERRDGRLSEPPRPALHDPTFSAEPLIETDKYRFAVPTFRPEDFRD